MKNKKEAELTELLEKANAHPTMKAILAEEAAKVLQLRQDAAGRIEQTREEAERVIPERQAKLDGLEAALAKHDEGRKITLEKLTNAKIALMQERQRLDRERSEAETALLGNYNPQIDKAILFFRDHHAALCRKKPNHSTHRSGTNVFRLTKQLTTYSNTAAIKGALTYCRIAIEELEKAKLIPEMDIARIEALKKGIPDTGELTEITADKPLPRPPDPLAGLPSESQQAWELEGLNEKFKKIMRR